MPVEPFDDPTQSSSGHAIVLTLINNIGADRVTGGKVSMVGLTVWPATPEGRQARDAIYDAFPAYPKRSKRRFEASIDRVGPGTLDLVETRRIAPAAAELLLGCTLSAAFTASQAGTPVTAIPLTVLTNAIASTDDTPEH